MSMFIGEALAGDGNEIAHIDLLIGSKDGPVGVAFANALARQSEGHSNLLAVLTPNLAVKPATVMITKVTIKGAKQAVQMFGPAQAAVAKAVADSVASGVIPKAEAENLVIVCGVFIHWLAEDDKKIYEYNYTATVDAIANAMKGKPTADEMLAGKDKAAHPFRGFCAVHGDGGRATGRRLVFPFRPADPCRSASSSNSTAIRSRRASTPSSPSMPAWTCSSATAA
jgi:5,6,7,8-tetrahydromethanopterin hydro-lyase